MRSVTPSRPRRPACVGVPPARCLGLGALRWSRRTVYRGAPFLNRAASSSAAPAEAREAGDGAAAEGDPTLRKVVACPVCQGTLARERNNWRCDACQLKFPDASQYADLVLESGVPVESNEGDAKARGTYAEGRRLGVTTFQNPTVSFAYERGWRQSFSWAGFPGADREFAMATDYLAEVPAGPLLDLSCGSGLFTRRFAAAGKWSPVVAADFSQSMLGETAERLKAESVTGVTLVRADARRLPFQSASFSAVHAGAAIHCWPQPELCVVEVARILRPGGRFCGSTFLTPLSRVGSLVGEDVLAPIEEFASTQFGQTWGARGEYKFWTERELRDLCARAGLKNFRCIRDQQFILFCADRP